MKEKMKDFLKENLIRLIVYASLAVLVLIVIFISSVAVHEANIPEEREATTSPQADKSQSQMSSKSLLNVFWSTEMAHDLIYKTCTENTSNNYITWCAVDLLDRKAAEREWKQRKFEMARHPQINQYNVDTVLEDDLQKIGNWRKGFEKMRDDWCEVEVSFRNGSGIPLTVASCRLEFELQAINTLNRLYYEDVLLENYDSHGIPNFEPTKADIDALIRVNATCNWISDDCEK